MSTISRDVLTYTIAPYIPLADLALEKDKDPAFEREYEQRIDNLLASGEDYQILTAALETQDQRLVDEFFQDVSTVEELEAKLYNAIKMSLKDDDLDLLIAVARYGTEFLDIYLLANILLYDIYSDFANEETPLEIGDASGLTLKEQFRRYVKSKYDMTKELRTLLDTRFKDIFNSALNRATRKYTDYIHYILGQSKYRTMIPADLLLSDLPLNLTETEMVDILRWMKESNNPGFEDYVQHVLEYYSRNICVRDIFKTDGGVEAFLDLLRFDREIYE